MRVQRLGVELRTLCDRSGTGTDEYDDTGINLLRDQSKTTGYMRANRVEHFQLQHTALASCRYRTYDPPCAAFE
ncbi:hypothetical protein GCM10007857_44570 [Bradyrhizobium iriomotense]|uniref:Uncharacterized protein n=1 Tax=Bradyrhizobium iriomotense TaxID=441950 RepID=A0ABQ6B1P4_9BRAD|nr:hypothetical protein GCM10007857_44570 [Bradyrhizobium iriomotense]